MPYKKNILIFFMLFCLLINISCRQKDSDETAPDNSYNIVTGFADLSEFTIVRGDSCSEAVTKAAVELRHLLEDMTGTNINIETDWIKRGDEIKRYGREILVGETNRPESIAVYENYNAAAEPLDYIIRSIGEHIVIALNDTSASEAVKAFAEAFIINESGAITDALDISRIHDFPVDIFKIAGHDISEYSIVYPAEYTELQKSDIVFFHDIIYRATGSDLSVSADDEITEGKFTIRIGTGKNDSFEIFHPLDYIISADEKGLTIGGSNYYADIKGIYKFLYEIIGYNYDGNFTKSEVIVTAGDIISRYNDIKILLGAWCTSGDPVETESQIREMAEAGFNHVNIQVPSDKQTLHNLLKWLAVYNLECLWFDGNVYANFTTEDFSEASAYIEAPVSWGNYLYDEPNSDKFDDLARAYKIYSEKTGKEPFINLFPMYATATQLGNSSYNEHVTEYLDKVKPSLCSVDIYPLNSYGLYDGYMQNLDIVASAARQCGIPLSVYIQSVSFADSKRTPSYADLEWQAYSCLSFGATGIMYFTYMTPYSTAENFKPALIDHDGNKTDRWYYAQKLNKEIAFFADVFTEYKNLGAFNHNSGADTAFLEFSNQYDGFRAIYDIDCANPLLIGCFEKTGEDKSYAFTAVNMTNLQSKKGVSDVRVRTDSPVIIYKNGESQTLMPDSKGYISFTLDVGEGVFCIITHN